MTNSIAGNVSNIKIYDSSTVLHLSKRENPVFQQQQQNSSSQNSSQKSEKSDSKSESSDTSYQSERLTGRSGGGDRGPRSGRGRRGRGGRNARITTAYHLKIIRICKQSSLHPPTSAAKSAFVRLDNQAEDHVIANKDLLSSIYEGENLILIGIHGNAENNMYGILPGVGEVIYSPTATANVLSKRKMRGNIKLLTMIKMMSISC